MQEGKKLCLGYGDRMRKAVLRSGVQDGKEPCLGYRCGGGIDARQTLMEIYAAGIFPLPAGIGIGLCHDPDD